MKPDCKDCVAHQDGWCNGWWVGVQGTRSAAGARKEDDDCGPDGAYFQKKEGAR